MKWHEEEVILKKKQENFRKARDLVYAFPDHEYIRLIPIPGNHMEIEVCVHGLSIDEKVMKIYNSLNNYIRVHE